MRYMNTRSDDMEEFRWNLGKLYLYPLEIAHDLALYALGFVNQSNYWMGTGVAAWH